MKKFMVETSARHVHLTQESVEILFGKGHTLTPIKDLSQPGQYASAEKVKIVGPKGELTARVLGPVRKADQVEVSLTDARNIGVNALIRESGHLDGTAGVKLTGPCGEVVMQQGLIAAKRHIHMHTSDAEYYGVKDGEEVSVRIDSPERSVIFNDVVIRVSDKFSLSMHLDTDEANAAGIGADAQGEIVK